MIATGELENKWIYNKSPKIIDKYIKAKKSDEKIAELVGVTSIRIKRYRNTGVWK